MQVRERGFLGEARHVASNNLCDDQVADGRALLSGGAAGVVLRSAEKWLIYGVVKKKALKSVSLPQQREGTSKVVVMV